MDKSYSVQNVTHEFSFTSSDAAQCAFSSCGRTTAHLHCRFCGYGTSQVTNAAAHSRLCPPSGDLTQTEASYSPPTQPFSYYPQSNQASSSTTKITQTSSVFNFSQYGGLYGPQTVFPNPNLFSPSGFSTYSQIDPSWISQSRLLPPPSEQNPNCCLPKTDADFGSQKYSDSISLLFLEQNKESEECINVDDICFDGNNKETETPRSSCMQKSMNLESSDSEESDIVVEDSEAPTENMDHPKCMVCEQSQKSQMTPVTKKSPLTKSSQTCLFNKLVGLLEDSFEHVTSAMICARCLNLVNIVDSLEFKLNTAITDLKAAYKSGKENLPKNFCHLCNKTFSSNTRFNRHQQYHTKSFAFCCEYCGRGFTCREKLENHVMLHTKSLRFQCELCGKQFLQKHTLTNHIRQHKGEYRYHCLICSKGFVQKTVFKIHVQSHEAAKFVCQHCGRKTKTYSNLMVHIKICSGNLPYECVKCQKKFALKSQLERHVAFKHENKSNFVCNICQKGFWRESDIVAHLRSHSDERPFICQVCGKRYKSKKNLNHHMKLHEEPSERSQLDCGVCGKAFTRTDALADHVNQHTGRKPYECKICWKRFANRINFSVHLKKHSRPNKSSCTVCGKLLGKSLKEHMRTHSVEKGFSCKLCMTAFTFKSSLNKHMRNKHSNQTNKIL